MIYADAAVVGESRDGGDDCANQAGQERVEGAANGEDQECRRK